MILPPGEENTTSLSYSPMTVVPDASSVGSVGEVDFVHDRNSQKHCVKFMEMLGRDALSLLSAKIDTLARRLES
jgi:hypothetical protein